MPNNRGLRQAYEIREMAAEQLREVHALPASTSAEKVARAKAFRDLTFVWNTAADRIRILRGRGLPKSVEPLRQRKQARAWTTPPPPEPGPMPSAEQSPGPTKAAA